MASRSQNGRLIRPKKKGVTSLRGHTLSVSHNNYRAIQSTELYRPNHIAVRVLVDQQHGSVTNGGYVMGRDLQYSQRLMPDDNDYGGYAVQQIQPWNKSN